LIQVNIWQGRLVRNLLRFLEAEQPDIICMQEVLSCETDIPPWDNVRSLERITETLGLPHLFFAPTWGFRLMGTKLYHGNAILSRYPLHDRQTLFTNGAFEEEAVSVPGINNVRNAQIARLEMEGKSLTVVNHHAHWEPNSMGSELSMERLKPLVDAIKPIEGPLIVAGDFNVALESPAMCYFEAELQLRNLTREHHVATTLSEFGHRFEVACDDILTRGEFAAQQFAVSNALVSDHKALILEFRLL